MATELRKWLAFGTGVGVEIRHNELDITVTRVRPTGVAVLGSASVTEFRTRPAAEWGREVLSFLRSVGAGHVAATVLLPRHELIVRVLSLPGVGNRDLDAAVQFQLDGLHPFPEDEAVHGYARIAGTPEVLVGITRRETIDAYGALFAEAGIKVAAFTFSAAAIYSATRLLKPVPAEPRDLIALHASGASTEIYGESAARPIYSAAVEMMRDRAVSLAVAELRLPPGSAPVELSAVLPKPSVFPDNYNPDTPAFAEHALPYATALNSACPRLSLPLNLLPADRRRASSRARYIPTAVLSVLVAGLAIAYAAESRWEDSRYLNVVQSEVKKLEPVARRASNIDRGVADVRARTQSLDDFRRRTRQDLDTLQEVTRLLPPPAWVNNLDLNRTALTVSGEADSAANLVETFDKSAWFRDSAFTTGIIRTTAGEAFRIQSAREFPAGAEPATRQQNVAAQQPAPVVEAAKPAAAAGPGAPIAPAPRPVQRVPNSPGTGAVPPGFGGGR